MSIKREATSTFQHSAVERLPSVGATALPLASANNVFRETGSWLQQRDYLGKWIGQSGLSLKEYGLFSVASKGAPVYRHVIVNFKNGST
jgi:hypothetical protein